MKITQRCYRRKLICLLGFVCLFLFVIENFIKTLASAETFWRLGHKITRHDIDGSLTLGYRKFRSFFGISPVGCVAAWNNLFYVLPEKSHPEHLLWAFLHIKQYQYQMLRLARSAFILGLRVGEKAIADRGYNDPNYFDFPNGENDQKKKEIMARHETLNGRLKQFSCLHDIFRHDLSLHPLYFNAVVNLTQMMIEHGEPLYSVDF